MRNSTFVRRRIQLTWKSIPNTAETAEKIQEAGFLMNKLAVANKSATN